MESSFPSLAIFKRWHSWLPWLYGGVAILVMIFPVTHLLLLLGWAEYLFPSSPVSDAEVVEVASSPHVRVLAPPGYVSQDRLTTFVDQVESLRTQVRTYLHVPENSTRITYLVLPRRGQNIGDSGSLGYVAIYGFNAAYLTAAHEMTFQLVGVPVHWLGEGFAVSTEVRFVYGFPLNAPLYLYERTGKPLPPLEDIYKYGRGINAFDVVLGSVRYLESASFCQYLIDTYGMDTFLENYRSPDFQKNFGHPIEELEQNWLTTLRIGHLMRGALVAVGGLVVLGGMHLALSRRRAWILAAVMGWVAFLAWSLFFFYLLLPFTLLIAFVAGGLIERRHPQWGLRALWLVGVGALAIIAILLPLVGLVRA